MIHHSYPSLSKAEIKAATQVLQSSQIDDGDIVRNFEKKIALMFDKKYATAVSSGFAAIHLALKGYGIGKNDEVIIPSYCCSALLNPILIEHAKPIIVDIDPHSFNISLKKTKEATTTKTKLIIIPHIFGFAAQIEKFKKLGVPILEDCAQSIGGTMHQKKLGSFTESAIFSFYATKMITGIDGGVLATNNKEVFETALNFRYYGHKKLHRYAAYNYKSNNVFAAIAMVQLDRLDSFVKKRKQIAEWYHSYLSSQNQIRIDFENNIHSCYYRYPVWVKDKERVRNYLQKNGIATGHGVLEGMHQMLNMPEKDFPETYDRLNHIISLPIYPSLRKNDVAKIAKNIIKATQI